MATYNLTLGSSAVLRLVVTEASQSIGSNYSNDSWALYLIEGTAPSFNNDPIAYRVTINGDDVTGTYTFDFRATGTQTKTIDTGTTRVYHNADGTKTTSVSGYTADTGTSSGGPGTVSGTLVQTRIPRGPFAEVDGAWSRTLAYAEIDGAWKQCLVYSEIDGGWQLIGG